MAYDSALVDQGGGRSNWISETPHVLLIETVVVTEPFSSSAKTVAFDNLQRQYDWHSP